MWHILLGKWKMKIPICDPKSTIVFHIWNETRGQADDSSSFRYAILVTTYFRCYVGGQRGVVIKRCVQVRPLVLFLCWSLLSLSTQSCNRVGRCTYKWHVSQAENIWQLTGVVIRKYMVWPNSMAAPTINGENFRDFCISTVTNVARLDCKYATSMCNGDATRRVDRNSRV